MEEKKFTRGAMEKLLKDFPWLWAIRQDWCPCDVIVKVSYASHSDMLMEIVPVGRDIGIKLWLKVKEEKDGEESDRMIEYDLQRFGVLSTILCRFKEDFPQRTIEYVVLVFNKDEKEVIRIIRPPKDPGIW